MNLNVPLDPGLVDMGIFLPERELFIPYYPHLLS